MQKRQSLSLQIAGAVALATLFGSSAFAESRHHEGTSRSSSGRIERSTSRSSGESSRSTTVRSENRSSDRGSWQRNDGTRNVQRDVTPRENVQRENTQRENTQRYESRNNGQRNTDWRGNNTQRNESRNDGQRYDSRNNGSRNNNDRRYESRNNSAQRYNPRNDRFRSVEGWHGGSRAPYRDHERVNSWGRVSRYERWHSGYRVWIDGGLFPIFVPFERWRLFPLRIGLNIRFGGLWDPLGYWSVYDYSPYDGYYGGGYYGNVGAYNTSGDVRGVVESVDYRRGTLVLNDDISRQFVTVTIPRDSRMNDVRPGDFIEFSGDWNRSGVFNAYRVERLDYNRDYNRDQQQPY